MASSRRRRRDSPRPWYSARVFCRRRASAWPGIPSATARRRSASAAASTITRAPMPAPWAISSSTRRRFTIRRSTTGPWPRRPPAPACLSPSSFSRTIDVNPKTVTAYHASFGVQRNIGWGTVVDASYVGSFGRHLGEVLNTNTVPYGAEFLPQNQNPADQHGAERQLLPALPRLQRHSATDLPGQFELPFPAGHREPALRQGRAVWRVLHPLQGHGLRRWRQYKHFGYSVREFECRRPVSEPQDLELRVDVVRPSQRTDHQLPV